MARLSAAQLSERRHRGAQLVRDAAAGEEPAIVRMRVLSSFNLDLAAPFLTEAFDRRGLSAQVRAGAFGQIAQEILDPASGLHEDAPGELLVVPAAEDLLGGIFDGTLREPDAQMALVDARLQELASSLEQALTALPASVVYLVAYGAATVPNPHVLDPLDPRRGQLAVERYVAGLRDLAGQSPRIILVDWDWHLRAVGADGLSDPRLWHLARMRLGPAGLAELADLVAGHVTAYRGQARKVAAVDLDGTVWGGIVGEVGAAGVDVGEDGPGAAFRQFQQELVRLHETGVVLVAASKNNEADALAVFAERPEMILRRDHFAAVRINWQDKATNLREMAAELNLGVDSFVFLDDNAVEREWIRQALPGVAVPELPDDPAARPDFLREAGLFERISLTDADRQRAASYATQGERARLRSVSSSFEDFLSSLEQVLTLAAVDATTLPRAAQLCQKTNQFNLTNRRHTAADLEARLAGGDFELHTVSVRDRFADSGITGLVGVTFEDDAAEVDTLLLSCRVLGRRIEHALLALIAERARERSVATVRGRYVATPKNEQVRTFLTGVGVELDADGGFEFPADDPGVAMPAELTIEVNDGAPDHS